MERAEHENLTMMLQHIEALYVHDERGRISAVNQWDGGVVPRLHIGRTATGNLYRFRSDIPDDLAAELRKHCEEEPPLARNETEPVYQDTYVRLLSSHAPVESMWAGPAYRFPTFLPLPVSSTVTIDESNARFLEKHMDDWLPDVPHRQPFVAIIEDGHAVSVCASVRITTAAHEAGVETSPKYRKRGHASGVVSAWALAVRSDGAEPLYSTSWKNRASQQVARALQLDAIGTDFHLT